MTSLRTVLDDAAARLAAQGVASPRHDAEALAAYVLRVPRSGLWLVGEIDDGDLAAYEDLVAERARRVPLQHLTGSAGFRHLDLAVGPGVFVPRPETEVLVDWGLAAIHDLPAPVVVDLCTGSGAIALAVAQEHPGAVVHAVEREKRALAWARRNADTRAHAGDSPITLHAGDATDPAVLADLDGSVDLVLCNPPYIPLGSTVEPEVAGHDPAAALWGGRDGLTVVRGIAARASRLLHPGGLLGVEHAETQGEALPALLGAAGGWTEIGCHPDLAGRPRFTTARLLGD